MRKNSLVAIMAAAAWCVSAHAALPPAASKHISKGALDSPNRGPQAQQQSVGPCVQPCAYFEDFDDLADFVLGTWIGNGLNGAAGGIFETWSATCSSNPANATSLTEGHVENAHPYSGTQHVRISKDFAAITNPFGCVLDARVPSSAVAGPNVTPLGPQTSSAYLAFNDGGAGANFQMQPQTPGNAMRTTTILFFYYGNQYVLDRVPGGATFIFAGSWDLSGAYHKYSIYTDPCAKWTCNGGANDALPCNGGADCPGGTCNGLINYLLDDVVFYTGQLWAGPVQDQILFYSDNTGGGAPTGMDIDDVAFERDPNPCPQVCGDGDITGSEECDIGLDGACPGLCVAAGGTGPNGEPECTCAIGACSVSQDLPNGGPQSFDDQFGWFTFTADAPAYAVETCGTQDYDSALTVWVGTCDSLALAPGNDSYGTAYNDDCYGGPVFGDGSDPLASCFDGALALLFPYNSCLCLSTNVGQQYWVWDPRVSFGDETVITLTKRLACDNNAEFGACCDGFADCTDVGGPEECLDGVYTSRKDCATVGDDCVPFEGACCDSFGDCTETDEAGCSGTFSLDVHCADAVCTPTDGACCNRIDGSCVETNAAGCTGNSTFSLGTHCDEANCVLATGACCDATPFAVECNDGVTNDQCQGENLTWTKDTLCADVTCSAAPIPTVSEWGLVIMALLLLVGAKVYFGRRESLA